MPASASCVLGACSSERSPRGARSPAFVRRSVSVPALARRGVLPNGPARPQQDSYDAWPRTPPAHGSSLIDLTEGHREDVRSLPPRSGFPKR